MKKGGTITFIEDLIKDKADFFAFFCMINGNNYENIQQDRLNYYLDIIDGKYKECLEILNNNYYEYKHSYNLKHYAMLLHLLNNINNNINKKNYGTEGHIIDNLINKDGYNYYNSIKSYIAVFKNDYNKLEEYKLENFFSKIGFDIAIYEFIYNKALKPDNIIESISRPTHKTVSYNKTNITKIFRKNFIKNFKELTTDNFIEKVNEEISKLKTYNIEYNFSKDDNILLQQYYNLYKYPTKFKNDKYIKENILYYNKRILKCDFDKELSGVHENYDIKRTILEDIRK